MGWQKTALSRLDELIRTAQEIDLPSPARYGARSPRHGEFYGWRARAISALDDIVGSGHVYLREFTERTQHSSTNNKDAGCAILKSLKLDVAAGYLEKLSDLISGEVFSDFLEMAKHLINQGYKDPAASLCGAVLEDGLRRIARNHIIEVRSGDDLNSLKDKCVQKGVFNNLVRQQITSWTTLRNAADHGNFGEYNVEQVRLMIEGVRSLLGNHLA
jgi:hypothetical protein